MTYSTNIVEEIFHFHVQLKSIWIQCLISLGVGMIEISLAMAGGYSAILLPQLEDSNDWEIDDDSSSWIASITALSMPVGCIFGSILMEKIGRKTTMILLSVMCTVGWIFIHFSHSMTVLLIGRCMSGLSVGIAGPVSVSYVAETSDPKYRGFLMSSISFAISFGFFLAHMIGSYLDWRLTALIGAAISFSGLILVLTPESPTYLVNIGRVDKAIRSFYTCRGRSQSSEAELMELIRRQKASMETKFEFNVKSVISDVMKPEFYKPMMIMLVYFWTTQWSGNNALVFYCVLIVRQAIGGGIDNVLTMFIIDSIRVIISVLACFLSKMFPRRILVLSSGFCMTACLLLTTVYMYLSKSYSLEQYSYIPVIGLVGYSSFLSVGFLPLSWVMVGEVFPQSQRGLGCGIASLSCYIWLFSVVKTVPFMISGWGIDTTFLIYTLSGLVGTVILSVVLPETKDKPLHEIEDRFKKKSVKL